MVENWEGKRRYVCRDALGGETSLDTTSSEDQIRLSRGEPLGIRKKYYPRVELQGSVRRVGAAIETISTFREKP